MSFWNIWSENAERRNKMLLAAEPAKLGALAVCIAGKYETYIFVVGTLEMRDRHLGFHNAAGGVTWFAPGMWSTVQTFPLSEQCQAKVREWAKNQSFDYIALEKIKT